MPKTVADGLWEMLVSAGVRRCYGIVGDALNPVVDAMRRNGSVDFARRGSGSKTLPRWFPGSGPRWPMPAAPSSSMSSLTRTP
jgi:hypothetical protein